MTKVLNPTVKDAIRELERIQPKVQAKVEGFYGRRSTPLGKVIITVEAKGRKRAYGGYTDVRTWHSASEGILNKMTGDVDERYNQITIFAETLNQPIDEIVAELVHQNIHLVYATDCRSYHGKWWENYASQFDLVAVNNGNRGWSEIKPTAAFTKWVSSLRVKQESFDKARIPTPQGKKGSTLAKWTCGCTNVWHSRGTLFAICQRCNGRFEQKGVRVNGYAGWEVTK